MSRSLTRFSLSNQTLLGLINTYGWPSYTNAMNTFATLKVDIEMIILNVYSSHFKNPQELYVVLDTIISTQNIISKKLAFVVSPNLFLHLSIPTLQQHPIDSHPLLYSHENLECIKSILLKTRVSLSCFNNEGSY